MNCGKLISWMIGVLGIGLSSTLLAALPFCLVTAEGRNCWYQTEAACEAVKDNHEFCIINPEEFDVEQEQSAFLNLPQFGEDTCLGPVCYHYWLEVCNEEERTVDQPLKCEVDPTP